MLNSVQRVWIVSMSLLFAMVAASFMIVIFYSNTNNIVTDDANWYLLL